MGRVIEGVGRSVSNLLGLSPDDPNEDQPEAPIPDDLEARRQLERKLSRRFAGKGRAGTILSGNNKLE